MRIFVCDSDAQSRAPVEVVPFPGRLRPPPKDGTPPAPHVSHQYREAAHRTPRHSELRTIVPSLLARPSRRQWTKALPAGIPFPNQITTRHCPHQTLGYTPSHSLTSAENAAVATLSEVKLQDHALAALVSTAQLLHDHRVH